jgi:hypothetical protein
MPAAKCSLNSAFALVHASQLKLALAKWDFSAAAWWHAIQRMHRAMQDQADAALLRATNMAVAMTRSTEIDRSNKEYVR